MVEQIYPHAVLKKVHLTVFLACAFLSACSSSEQTAPRAIAERYCGTCHAFPEPELLDRQTWMKSTLPEMGYRLGIYTDTSRNAVIKPLLDFDLDPEPFYPSRPTLSKANWQAILDYYERHAPKSLHSAPQTVRKGLDGFVVHTSSLRFKPPFTTDVEIYDEYQAYSIGNYASNSKLVVLNKSDQLMFDFDLDGAPTDTEIDGSSFIVSLAGPGPEPTAGSLGSVYAINNPNAAPVLLANQLLRPVDIELGDLDNDGLKDLVICEYGHYEGALSWYKNTGIGTYERHELNDVPGTVAVKLHDFDNNGFVDIIALTAQGDEGVDLYLNQGNGMFEPRRVLRFPPVYGSTDLELYDFNQDGLVDILYTNGDNADSSPIPKPYHGVRIYLSDETLVFSQAFFYPMHGAMAARAADFDEDGDLDITTIAYFPDYTRTPEHSMVYLEGKGAEPLLFEPYTFEDSFRGRWLTMDTGDLDGDGDIDILLGSNIGFAPKGDGTGLFERWNEEAISSILLENILRSY